MRKATMRMSRSVEPGARLHGRRTSRTARGRSCRHVPRGWRRTSARPATIARHVVHAHDVGAAQHAGRHRGRRAHAAARPRAGRARVPMKLLREGPTSTGRSRAASSRQAPQHLQAVGRGLGEADAGIDDDLRARDARRLARVRRAWPQLRDHLRHDVRRSAARGAWRRSRRAGASAPPARPGSRPGGARPGSKAKPLTSLTRSAPASRAARATSALVVSTETSPAPAARAGPR